MNLFDTHSHYNLDPIWSQWSTLMKKAQAVGLKKSLVVGTDLETSRRALFLKKSHPDFFLASLGLHPSKITEQVNCRSQPAYLVKEIIDLMTVSQFDAYGEIGLDFYRLDKSLAEFKTILNEQLIALRAQLNFALKNPKPLIFHIRDEICDPADPLNAYHLILKTIYEENIQDHKIIFHCFSGNEDYLSEVLTLPHSYISFAGNLTFKSAHQLRQCFKLVPPERLLLETDAPFLSPEPQRGQFCQPSFFKLTANYAAANLNLDLLQIYQNSIGIFS